MRYPIKIVVLSIFICYCQFQTYSQSVGNRYVIDGELYNSSIEINPENFIAELLRLSVIDEINKMRLKNYVEILEESDLLRKAATDQSIFMASSDIKSIDRKEKGKRTTAERLNFYGGSKNGLELIEKVSISNRDGFFSYQMLAFNIVFKWFMSSKTEKILLSKNYIFLGLGTTLNNSGDAVYISCLLGNYDTFNSSINNIAGLEIPITQKSFGFKLYNEKECKKLNKYDNLNELQKGLLVENGEIYFQHDDMRFLKRIFRKSKDGLMVDLVQKDQYQCNEDNLIDNNLSNKGVILAKVYTKKLFKNNLIDDRESDGFKTFVGNIPESFHRDYELNLILLQNKYVCKNFHKTYIQTGVSDYTKNVELLADTITINSEFEYFPSPDTTLLSFRIPFEKKKYTFKTDDIKPLIDSLDEPDFQIHEIEISAFTSVEGTNDENKMLQQKRAKSIINAIKKMQSEEIISHIETADNWELFRQDILQTEFSSLAKMSMEKAQEQINKMNLDEQLESILSKHRYAQVDMKVTYNLNAQNEQKYVIKQFNKAVAKKDLPLALSIQKYIFKKVLLGSYSPDVVFKQKIPSETDFAGMLMNKVWLEKFVTQNDLSNYADRINALYELNQNNDYIKFNYVFLHVELDEYNNVKTIQEYQSIINDLYFSTFTKKTVDGLNIKHQLKVIRNLSPEENQKNITKSLDRLKKVIEVRDIETKDALKLAYMFIDNKDYNYAYQLLNPFILKADAEEDFIFTYLSVCSQNKMHTYSNRFIQALEKANYLNHNRFCELFNGNYFSFQVFDNFKAKEYYCTECVQ
jgi:uncharacterized protein YkwD